MLPQDTPQRRNCPCKHLRQSLSSFTAAEHGNVNALRIAQQRQRRDSTRQSKNASPLHLAAQHGHVAATAFLLQQGNGRLNDSDGTLEVTPLHRASFSGAVSTMLLLLDSIQNNANAKEYLLKPDTSFGDAQTALHKAASGGRYLAVGLLLEALKAQGCLKEGLTVKDAAGRTPRDVAVEKRMNEKEERKSVARWNEVAGGFADWDKCVQLLRSAEFKVNNQSGNMILEQNALHHYNVPTYLTTRANPLGADECLDCTEDGRCKAITSSWEDSFRKSLLENVNSTLPPDDSFLKGTFVTSPTPPDIGEPPTNDSSSLNGSSTGRITTSNPASFLDSNLGEPCEICGTPSIALFKQNGQLVCKSCRRR